MIITKKWLEEWIDLEGISTEDICKKLNEIGLEVDGVKHQRIVDGVVVGFVKSCEKHPDAQKLSLCEVDIGSEVVQIVCGAPNVAKGQYVAVATVGTTLSNGLQIKPAKLRGVESNGMLCSSTELDLPKINDGIMLLDESIGELKLGDKLSQNSFLNDDVIEIGLTPNRGDCLGVRGVARDLAVAFKKELKEQKCIGEDENYLGIGRVLSLQVEGKLDSSFIYKVVSQEEIRGNLLIDLRLSAVEIKADDLLQKMVEYASYSTGVLLRVYDKNSFEVNEDRATIVLKKGDSGFDLVCGKNGVVSHVGFNTNEKANKESKVVILEASFTPPELMAQLGANHKDLPPDKHLYRSARGSETQLELGIDCCLNLLCKNSDAKIYVGEQSVKSNIHVRNIVMDLDELNLLIGQEISKNVVMEILKSLSFEVQTNVEQNTLHVSVPQFRHDVQNWQDLCEEIVRIIGIDNIASKPYEFAEKSRENRALKLHRLKTSLRNRSAGVGFNETMHYVFDDSKLQLKYNLVTIDEQKELLNPITSELNSLRTTLALHLLEACSFNIKNSKKRVPLFEIGRVFDSTRAERTLLGFVYCGELEDANITNHGKPKQISFFEFAKKISSVIGDFEVVKSPPKNLLANVYEHVDVVKNGKVVGYITRVHLNVERDFDLPTTYLCEIDLEALHVQRLLASEYSKFQASTRDLSLIIPKDMEYKSVSDVIRCANVENLVDVYAIDTFHSEKLGEKLSLTIKLTFQNMHATLEESQIQDGVDAVLKVLDDKLGIGIR